MKFRSIFILFNVILALSFLFIFLMPVFVVGPEVSGEFFARAWPLAILFVAVLCLLNGFFLANRKVFTLVEREDWSGLAAHLVELVFVRRRYRQQHVRLLVNAYMLQSDLDGIRKLERELAGRDRPTLARNAAIFAPVYLLRGDSSGALAFVRDMESDRAAGDREWLSAYGGLAAAYAGDSAEAVQRLGKASRSRDPVLACLACHVLSSSCNGMDGVDELVEPRRKELRTRFTRDRWQRELEKAKSEVHVVVLSKLLDDATVWLFG